MHTVLDLRGSIPDSIYITDSRYHDSNFLDVYEPYKWAIYTMDKAYVDLEALYRMHVNNIYFVTRAKVPMKYEVVDRDVLQMDQGKPYHQSLLGLLGERCQGPSLGCYLHLPVACLGESCAQKPADKHRSLKSSWSILLTKTDLRELLDVPAPTHSKSKCQ